MSAKVFGSCLLVILLLALLIFRWVKSPGIVNASEEQALIITIPLRSGKTGNPDELKRLHVLEDQLNLAIKDSKVGEYDGDEVGEGVFTIYIYGPSAERLFAVVRPILKRFRPPTGSFLIKRYGKLGSKQDRVAVDSDDAPTK
jgi:hypothetical protein